MGHEEIQEKKASTAGNNHSCFYSYSSFGWTKAATPAFPQAKQRSNC